jgi:hypothetical protein
MTDQTFNNKILDRIHHEHIAPRSRWYFITEHWFMVGLIGLATFMGSIAVATTLFVLTDHDWFAVAYLDEDLFTNVIKTIPYIWLGIIVLVLLVIYINIKKIGRGYRYASWKIIFWSLLASLSVGLALFLSGVGGPLDRYLDRHLPGYSSVVSTNKSIWMYPENGLLSGKVESIQGKSFDLVDDDGQPWTIAITADTAWKTSTVIPGMRVKITGVMTDGDHFTASRILPWRN